MMDLNQESFLIELLNDFRIEATEHHLAIVGGLMMLERESNPSVQQSTIEKIFREVHSLKGAARAVNLLDIEKLCMSLENIFNSLKKGELNLYPPMFEILYKSTDLLNLLLKDVNQNQKNKGNYNLAQILKNLEYAYRNALTQIKAVDPGEPVEQNVNTYLINNDVSTDGIPTDSLINVNKPDEIHLTESLVTPLAENQTVRISTAKLTSLLQQTEELIFIKSTFDYYSKDLQSINNNYSLWNKHANEKISKWQNSPARQNGNDFVDLDKNFRKNHEDALNLMSNGMVQFQRIMNRMIDELLLDIKSTLLFPFSSMLSLFPKIVRDLSKEYSKDIDIVIIGDTIEIDRRILEEIKNPLIHLIRNCIDHGIEDEKERIIKGKPAKGKIEIKISQNSSRKIELQISDDGGGIDKTKIINSALKLGIIEPNEIKNLSDSEIYSLIFSSGVSTSPFITDISGRGLGMAIVAEKVAKLGGNIEIKTTKNAGTSFTILLPQTLATFRGIVIKSSNQFFIIPSSAVEKVLRIKFSDIKTVESKQTIFYKSEMIGLALLSDVLKITVENKKKKPDDYLLLLIFNISQKKIAFVVDEILAEQEGIVKDLGSQLLHVNHISGATILGNGKVVPILNPSELIDSAAQTNTSIDSSDHTKALEPTKQKNILVAEDSITIRTLLRNFIENAGFSVKTAVDGMEAYKLLQNENFDLVVSDIEMPRMNGFELTAKIRDDKNHADIPVILVTALESADDKKRGMDVGANAYIIKSSFEKSNLIETIQRLI